MPKKGRLGLFADLRRGGLARKRWWCFLRRERGGVETPMHTMFTLMDFWQIVNSVLSKSKSVITSFLMAQRCSLLHLIKQSSFLKTFLVTIILMIPIALHLLSFVELI